MSRANVSGLVVVFGSLGGLSRIVGSISVDSLDGLLDRRHLGRLDDCLLHHIVGGGHGRSRSSLLRSLLLSSALGGTCRLGDDLLGERLGHLGQAAPEVEALRLARRALPLREQARGGGKPQLRRIAVDTWAGMIVSNVVAAAIMITTAATLHAAGITSIQSSAQAAEALRPLAGEFTFMLFALGVIGTGMLAVPVLAGSAAYALSEAFGWPATLEARPSAAPRFYALIAAATLAGVAIDFTPIDPIRMLFWSAVINGVVAAPIMAVMLMLACDRRVMGDFVLPRGLKIAGWAATALMAMMVLALVGAGLWRGGMS